MARLLTSAPTCLCREARSSSSCLRVLPLRWRRITFCRVNSALRLPSLWPRATPCSLLTRAWRRRNWLQLYKVFRRSLAGQSRWCVQQITRKRRRQPGHRKKRLACRHCLGQLPLVVPEQRAGTLDLYLHERDRVSGSILNIVFDARGPRIGLTGKQWHVSFTGAIIDAQRTGHEHRDEVWPSVLVPGGDRARRKIQRVMRNTSSSR